MRKITGRVSLSAAATVRVMVTPGMPRPPHRHRHPQIRLGRIENGRAVGVSIGLRGVAVVRWSRAIHIVGLGR